MHQKDSKKPQYITQQQRQTEFRLTYSLFTKAAAHQQKFEDTNGNTASMYGTETKTGSGNRRHKRDSMKDTKDETCGPRDRSRAPWPGALLATTETEHQVKGGLLLDVVVRQGAAILKLLTSKDQALLVRGDALLVLDLRLHVVNGVR